MTSHFHWGEEDDAEGVEGGVVFPGSGSGGVLHYSNGRNGCVEVGMQTSCVSGKKEEYCMIEKFSERGQSLCGVCDGG